MLIVMTGFSKSGKTTLVDQLLQDFPNTFVAIDSAKIHNFLNSTYYAFQDDNTIMGSSYKLREDATKKIQGLLQEVLVENNFNVIDDSVNSTKQKRAHIISQAKELDPEIRTLIIYIKISEPVLLSRLIELDEEKARVGQKKSWVDLYYKIQKPIFYEPQSNEADHIFVYTPDKYPELIKLIQSMLIR